MIECWYIAGSAVDCSSNAVVSCSWDSSVLHCWSHSCLASYQVGLCMWGGGTYLPVAMCNVDSLSCTLDYYYYYLELTDSLRKDNVKVTLWHVNHIYTHISCWISNLTLCVTTETPSQVADRTLKLVTKAVQNLANLVEFKAKEPYMVSLNDFIRRHLPKMRQFIDDISVSSS